MPDAHAFDGRIELRDALRALPMETPERSAWPALAARLAAPAPRRRGWPLLAAAAALIAAVLWLPATPTGTGDTRVAVAANDNAAVDQLISESARLERVVAAASDDTTGNGSALSLSLALEDRLHAIDASLTQADLSSGQRQALWQERVSVLRAAANFETSRRYDAAQGRGFELGLVAAL